MKSVFRIGFKNGITNNIPLIKKIHFISIGGRIMHTLAIVLQEKGFQVTGSDDEIYDPSLSRLREKGLAPEKMGWYPEKVDSVDAVILGMHARVDNPELIRAQELNLPIYSFPSFVQEVSKEKQQVVISGSHGKTTTTAMIMHVLSDYQIDFDYLVGASIRGFDQMVRLSQAPLMLIEGDEYLSSPIDRSPKFSHFHPDIAVMTGIAWDHINVFPTEEAYVQLFRDFATQLKPSATLIYYAGDPRVKAIGEQVENGIAYKELSRSGLEEVKYSGDSYPIQVIGSHNLQNMAAALEVCQRLGIRKQDFFTSIASFSGADRRLEVVAKGKDFTVFFDFAHAPSKVKATTSAVQDWYAGRSLVACLELHTYSSMNMDFIPQYKGALDTADVAIVFYSPHALLIKKMPDLDPDFIKKSFGRPDLEIFTDSDELKSYLNSLDNRNSNLLMMSSGRFGGLDMSSLWK